jgi:hypothetical protein
MTDQLEAELRQAFAARASQVPADAVDRLRRVDYRPRLRRRWPLTVTALGTASGTAAAVSVLVLGGAQTAYAGWSATPAHLTAAQGGTTPADCASQLPTPPGGWTQVASDVRGPYTMTVYVSGTSLASCFSGPSFTSMQAESTTPGGPQWASVSGSRTASGPGSLVTNSSRIQVLAGTDISQLLVTQHSQSDNGPYTLAEGRLAPGVSAVTLVLSNGQDVATTTGAGWFVAWWPGSEDVTAAQVTTASGTTTEPLHTVARPTPFAGHNGG